MRLVHSIHCACLLVVLAGFLSPAYGQGTVTSVTILAYSGKAEVSRREGVWDPAHTNQVLLVGDKMRTGTDSRASIRLSDGTTMTIGAEASFSVPQPESKGSVMLNPIKGLFYFFHRDKPGEFELRNRSTAAAVRGTEFHLNAQEDGSWEVSVLDGDVFLQNDQGGLDLKTGEAGLARPGQKPEPIVMRQAADLIQWVLYYPAVLDVDELVFSDVAREALKDSLMAYRLGDLSRALALCPMNQAPGSDMEAIYRAQLLLSVGEVGKAEGLLSSLSGERTERVRVLKAALEELIAVVKGTHVNSETRKIQTASEWLAESYRLQADSKLPEALAAARRAVAISPNFGFGWERVAELEFSFGRVPASREALGKSLTLAPRNAEAQALQGFLLAADNRIEEATKCFDQALALNGALGNAWLGRGLCRIRRGDVKGGKEDLLVAAALEPKRSIFRSYLGKAFSLSGDTAHAQKEMELAKKLDPHDPTAWLYSSLLLLEQNRVNEAIDALETSVALNGNRSIFRSRQLLDQDRAVREANLAAIYQDDGMNEVAVRAATRAVESDYANYSAHLFLANSYNALRDPQQFNLRYETPWLTEYLIANLLSPGGSGTLSPLVSQQEYSRLFEQDGPGIASTTEYSSRGDWTQSAAQYGTFGNSSYAVEDTYRSQNGDRANNDLQQLTLSLRWKQQLTPRDSIFFQAVYYDADSGDPAQYYNQSSANPTLRVKETQEPLLLLGYHHEWAPGIHTLALAGRLEDTVHLTNAEAGTLFFGASGGVKEFGSLALYNQQFNDKQETYISEIQQLFETESQTLIVGGRFQTGDFKVHSLMQNGHTFPGGTATGDNPIVQDIDSNFQRLGIYAYEQWRPVDSLLLIGGVSYDDISYPANYLFVPVTKGNESRSVLGPKAGVVWTPNASTTVRAGYSRSVGGVSFDQSFRLEPSQIAGFNQAFRSLVPEAVEGSIAAAPFNIYGVQLEKKFPSRTYFGITGGLLQSDTARTVGAVQFDLTPNVPTPDPFQPTSTQQRLNYDEYTVTATLNQLIGDDFAVGASYQWSRAELKSRYPGVPADISISSPFALRQDLRGTLQQVRLYALFNHPSGFFCGTDALWTGQDNGGYSPALAGDDFWQFNTFGGYRWWQRRAEVRLALLNFTGQNYHLNPLNLTTELPRERTLTVSLSFFF